MFWSGSSQQNWYEISKFLKIERKRKRSEISILTSSHAKMTSFDFFIFNLYENGLSNFLEACLLQYLNTWGTKMIYDQKMWCKFSKVTKLKCFKVILSSLQMFLSYVIIVTWGWYTPHTSCTLNEWR